MADAPVAAPDDAFFWEGVAVGRLLIQRCASCGALRHPPAPMCGDCGSLEWDTRESSGRGHVYSYLLSHHPNRPDERPRIVILVQLEEGVRLVSNLIEPPHDGPYEDLDVEVVFATRADGTPMPYFRPVRSAGTPSP